MRWLRNNWSVVSGVVIMAFVITTLLVTFYAAYKDEPLPDLAGRNYTEIPFRRYSVGDRRVIAFELYGLKCIAIGVALDCENTDG